MGALVSRENRRGVRCDVSFSIDKATHLDCGGHSCELIIDIAGAHHETAARLLFEGEEKGREKKNELKNVNERAPFFLMGGGWEKNLVLKNPLSVKRSVRERASTPRTTYRVRVRAHRSVNNTRIFRSAPWSQCWRGERGR